MQPTKDSNSESTRSVRKKSPIEIPARDLTGTLEKKKKYTQMLTNHILDMGKGAHLNQLRKCRLKP